MLGEHHCFLLWMLKAYVLADRLLAPRFRRATNNVFVSWLQGGYDNSGLLENAIFAFDNISPERPILQLIADTHCRDRSDHEDTPVELEDRLPYAFLMWVLKDGVYTNVDYDSRCYLEHSPHREKYCHETHMAYNEEARVGYFHVEEETKKDS
jgi:hypothetical protein